MVSANSPYEPPDVPDMIKTEYSQDLLDIPDNPIITAYIEKYLAANTDTNPYQTIETLRDEIRRKDEQIARLVQRDATISECKAKNQELMDEIASLRTTIKSQEELIQQLRSQRMHTIK